MSERSPDFVAAAASTTSSGFADGLGRRVLAFDREEGTMLERLAVRPEIAAFEKSLRARLEQVAALEDQRIARPRTVERDLDGSLIVVSEFVPGSRLSDLLDVSAGVGVVPGVDAACGYLFAVLPALCGLHAGATFAHGTIAPSRTVLTPAGEVVLLDAIYGDALSHLRYSRQRLWTDFGVAAPPSAGTPRLGFEADIAQVALSGMMLAIGRTLGPHEYPAALPAVMREVAEAAQIRSSSRAADGLLHFFHRALALPGSRPYTSADDALIDLRELGNELGRTVCRRALVEFIEQMETGGQVKAGDFDEIIADIESYGLVPGGDGLDPEARETGPDEAAQDLDEGVDAEIDLEELVEEPHYELTSVTDLPDDAISIDSAMLAWPHAESPEQAIADADASQDEPLPEALDAVSFAGVVTDPATACQAAGDPGADVPWVVEETAPAVRPGEANGDRHTPNAQSSSRVALDAADPTGGAEPAAESDVPLAPDAASPVAAETERPEMPAAVAPQEGEPGAEGGARDVRTRRAKRTRSARARKDKLRSVAAGPAAISAPAPAPSAAPPPSAAPEAPAMAEAPAVPVEKPVARPAPASPPDESWLVPPDRAAAFEPPVNEPAPTPSRVAPAAATPAFTPAAAPPFVQPAPPFTQPPAPPFAQPGVPLYVPPPAPPAYAPPAAPAAFSQITAAAPGYSPAVHQVPVAPAPQDSFLRPQTPIGVASTAAGAWTPSNPTQHASYPATAPQPTPLKLKEPATSRPRGTRAPAPVPDIYSAPVPTPDIREAPAQFPWKMAGAALALVALAVIGGRMLYLPDKGGGNDPAETTPIESSAVSPTRQTISTAPAGKTGRLEIDTQPAGARVLLDGKPAGESPLALEGVPIGRHTLTFVSASGSVKRTVRIEAGRTVKLDVPIFSGWVGIFAPFIVEVAEEGRLIGTTENPRIMLSPGRHVLTLSNKALGYRSVQTVEIEPGEVRSLTLDPRGSVNLNAAPWAEVWIDGKKAGETPIANHAMPLGTREIVFRHPQFGERKVTVTVTANGPAAVSVDMARP